MRYFLVISGKKLLFIAAICVSVCLIGCLAIGMGKTMAAASTKRDLPIYSVDRKEKVCALTFDAAWDNGTMRKNHKILIMMRKAAVVLKVSYKMNISTKERYLQ